MRATVIFFSLVVLLGAAPTRAQEVNEGARAAARQMAYDGIAAYKNGQYADAYGKIGRAYSVIRVPTLGLWTARSLERLGRLVEASERYLEIGRLSTEGSADAELQEAAKKAAATERAALLERIPRLRIVVEGVDGSSVEVTVDGRPLPRALVGAAVPTDPGKHRVQAKLGARVAIEDVALEEQQSRDVVLKLESDPTVSGGERRPGPTPVRAGPESTKAKGGTGRLLGYIGIGAGGAVLAGGVTFGVLSLGTKKKLDAGDCLDGKCGPSMHDEIDTYDRQRLLSTIGITAGAALAAGGVTLLLTSPKLGEAKAAAALSIGPGSIDLRGTF